jgi:DNA-binding NarL/FixJ family response regulator
MTLTALIVDDQELVRTGLRAILAAQPDIDVVAEAGDGLKAVSAVQRLRVGGDATRCRREGLS